MNSLPLYKILLTLLILSLRFNAIACDTLCVVYNQITNSYVIDTLKDSTDCQCNLKEIGIYSGFINKLVIPYIFIESNTIDSINFKITGKEIIFYYNIDDYPKKEFIDYFQENNFEFDSVYIKIRYPEYRDYPDSILNPTFEQEKRHYGIPDNDSISTEIYAKTNINYKAYALTDKYLFVINDSGQIVIWDNYKNDTIHFAHNDTSFRYTCITKNRQNDLFLGTDKGDVFKLNPVNFKFQKFLSLKKKYHINNIVFNSKDEIFIIYPYIVYDPAIDKYWDRFLHPPTQVLWSRKVLKLFFIKTDKYFFLPDYTYIDSYDHIWMTKYYGEYGSDLQIFDSKNLKCVKPVSDSSIFYSPVQSIFEDDKKNIYITTGLQHMFNYGKIYQIDSSNIAKKIFNSNDYVLPYGSALFLGPGIYNRLDSCIYFASSFGFFKTDLISLKNHIMPKFLFWPSLNVNYHSMACGYKMPVVKMEFTSDNKLIFLTTDDGIGIYDGKKLVFLK